MHFFSKLLDLMKWIKLLLNVSTGHKKAIELLIEKGADVNAAENRWKHTPLHWIALFSSSVHGHENWTEDDRLSNFQFNFCYFLLLRTQFQNLAVMN